MKHHDFQTHCPERYWFKGMRQSKDDGIPASMWGGYFPGDNPGYMCKLEGGGCADNPEDCPMFEEIIDEPNLLYDGHIYYNKESGEFIEPEDILYKVTKDACKVWIHALQEYKSIVIEKEEKTEYTF